MPVCPSALLPLLLFFSLYFLSALPLPGAGSRPTCSILMPHYLCLCWNWQEINPALIYSPLLPSPSSPFLRVLLPLPAVKCPFWTEHKHQHNIMPYQSRHKDPWAHCSSVSGSSSFCALSASAKPRKHIRDRKQDNRMKTGVATRNHFRAKCIFNCSAC